ncbi:MAG: ATP-binding protein [Bacteroidales bacterium]|nr:ATP-binding protein [Bacteroidales bacterium]
MDRLIEKSNKSIHSVQYPYQRNVIGNINWEWRMNGIIGARGTGKTTLLLQKLQQFKKEGKDVLYIRLDDLYFVDNRLYDLADTFRKNGGEYLYIDEVHKYKGWAREMKNIYDSIQGLKLVFSGPSIVEITEQDADLSRRALLYEMTGLSFREYLLMADIISLQAYTLNEILTNHLEIASEIVKQIPVLKYFSTYLKSGFYPYFLESDRDYFMTLEQIIRTVIDTDLRFIENLDVAQSKKMLTLLKVIAASVPFKPNISKISLKTNLHRQTVLQYFLYLEKARMIKLVNLPERYISRLQKPDKIFLDNPNLFFALNPEMLNKGNLRETFALNQLSVNNEVFLHKQADFFVDNKFVIEIGGKNKDTHQIRNIENSFIFQDDIETGHHNIIPLWLLGFLY